MKSYEITFDCLNSENYVKPITALIYEPDNVTPDTGAMLFTHGWSGHRLAYTDWMKFAVDDFNLVCISTEFRQSGYDFNPITGIGSYQPYDTSFLQTLDTLNALRTVLDLRPGINRERLFHYGGSQGGHISLLSSIFAPQTFAFVYAACPVTHIDDRFHINSGRVFAPWELSVRNVIEHAEYIQTPVVIEHGTADPICKFDTHYVPLVEKMQSLGREIHTRIYPNTDHMLGPAPGRLNSFKERSPEFMAHCRRTDDDDLLAQRIIRIACADKIVQIDWSKPADSMELIQVLDNE